MIFLTLLMKQGFLNLDFVDNIIAITKKQKKTCYANILEKPPPVAK